MAAIGEFKQAWRLAGLVLLILALIGPWTYEVIYVQAEYSCSAPYIRLEGDFCGEPISGAWILSYLALGFISNLSGFLAGTISFAGRARELLFMFLSIFPVLALLSTLLLLWKKDSRSLNIFQLVAWGLATVLSLIWIVFDFNGSSTRLLWGAWIYAGLTPVVLIMELLALNAERKEKQ